MKIAVLSDVHANLEALQSVLADLDRQAPDLVVSLGDCIGYGPEPEATARLLRERGVRQVLGNHELACLRRKERTWFNPVLRKDIPRTCSGLSPESQAWIARQPLFWRPEEPGLDSCHFVHGCPPDDVRKYLFQLGDRALAKRMAALGGRVCFVGHTHELGLVHWDGRELRRADLGEGPVPLPPDLTHIVNVGSVGQPRELDRRAKYVLWEPGPRLLTVRCVDYDAERTAAKILALGLPEQYARRLR